MKEGHTLDEHLAAVKQKIEATKIETIEEGLERMRRMMPHFSGGQGRYPASEGFKAGVAWAFRQFARLQYEWALDAEDADNERSGREDYDAMFAVMSTVFKGNAHRLMERAMGDAHWSPPPWWREREEETEHESEKKDGR